MSETKYSLTSLLGELTKIQSNSYQILAKLSDVMNSSEDSVSIDVIGGGGIIQSVQVPSFGGLKQQLTRLENNINSLSNVNASNTAVQLSDGSFRNLLIRSFKAEADDIKTLKSPTTFATKENWFFESFLNPLLYVTFDLSNEIKAETETLDVARYILKLDTPAKESIWKKNFKSKSDISFINFSKICIDNNITYFLDKSVIDMPPRNLQYNGKFMVSMVSYTTYNETVNNITTTKKALKLNLSTLMFNDVNKETEKTEHLKKGDFLILGTNTRYKILEIFTDDNSVSVELIEGFDVIAIGSSLSYYNENLIKTTAQVNIGFNEYCVIFIKAIDPDSKLEAANWSPGVGIYTNDLEIADSTSRIGKTSLATYYQNEVVDFGSYLYASVKDKTIPSIYGIIPNKPTLEPTNFKVVPINDHLTTNNSIQKIIELNSDKIKVQSQIAALDKTIADMRNKIQTTKYTSDGILLIDQNNLKKYIADRSSQSTLYASIISDINTISANNSVDNLTQKYRLRGFFPFPEPKTSSRTNLQEVIQFKIQYRYVKKDGSANKPVQMEFKDNDGTTLRGTFSPWINYLTPIRDRAIDSVTGNAYWITENVESAETININQLDLSIQEGEGIEFRIKSISEAGWPLTAIESDWTSIIRVDFPAEYESLPDANSIIEQSRKESVKIEMNSELVSLNLDKVAASTVIQNGKFYTTSTVDVASGFLTPENNVISLYDKLVSIENELNNIKTLITNAKGKLSVSIIDENGNEYKVENNTNINIFAGNYKDKVASIINPKGTILTNQYFIKIVNDAASDLELYSRIWGSSIALCNSSIRGTGFISTNEDYNNRRKYDLVPIGLSNPSSSDITSYKFIRQTPEQSGQVQSQFINSRYTSFEGTLELYTSGTGGTGTIANEYSVMTGASALSLYNTYSGGTAGFIWCGITGSDKTFNESILLDQPNYLYLHKNHPAISTYGTSDPLAVASIYNRIAMPAISTSSIQQNILNSYTIGSTSYNGRLGFNSNDKYLIGPKSCGSYLFLNPNSHSDLVVNGSDSLSYKTVKFGYNNAITIPFIYQYRMTDYFGDGDTGIGKVGGDQLATTSTNLSYTKRIGIDIYSNPIDSDRFSFDITVTSRYYSNSITSSEIPTRTFANAIDTLTKTIKYTSPSTSK